LPTTSNNKPRDAALDGIRGIAIALVMFHHHIYYSGIDRNFWYDLQIFKLTNSMWLGVDLFFVLSGFLITGILYDAKSSDRFFSSFYGRRVLRIFPLYFGFLLLAVLFLPYWLNEDATLRFYQSQGWYWTFLANIHIEPAHKSTNHY
jgi:peptidoglycan/LPS O-acetylase OafA/YrhL